ncbi:MAG: CDP-diacylglycerol--glycerol-3-phosphate 3-phosphatidyltransferase [Myxococcota bacterium]
MNLPNILTAARVVVVPLVMLSVRQAEPWWNGVACSLFALAALTDFVDGYLARRWGQVTTFGKIMDPLADKLLVLGALVMLLSLDRVSPWLVFLLLGREFAVTTLRVLAVAEGLVIAARPMGKQKTVLQMMGVGALLAHERVELLGIPLDFHLWGTWLLVLGVVWAVVSGVDYGWAYVAAVRGADDEA